MILSGGLTQLFLSFPQWNWVCCLPTSIWTQRQCGCSLMEQLFSRLSPGTRTPFLCLRDASQTPNLSQCLPKSGEGSHGFSGQRWLVSISMSSPLGPYTVREHTLNGAAVEGNRQPPGKIVLADESQEVESLLSCQKLPSSEPWL